MDTTEKKLKWPYNNKLYVTLRAIREAMPKPDFSNIRLTKPTKPVEHKRVAAYNDEELLLKLELKHKTEEEGASYPDYRITTRCTPDCPACEVLRARPIIEKQVRWNVGEELCCLTGNKMLEDMEAGKLLGSQLKDYMNQFLKF